MPFHNTPTPLSITALRAYRETLKTNDEKVKFELLYRQWAEVSAALLLSNLAWFDDIQPWMNGEDVAEEPDLLTYVATVGKSQNYTGSWKQTPLPVSEEEADQWEETGDSIVPTVKRIRQMEDENIWGFTELLNANYQRTIDLVNRQLQTVYAKLKELREQPLEAYRPREYDWSDDEYGETQQQASIDIRKMDEIFALYTLLEEFELGLESIRMAMVGIDVPDLGLPNPKYLLGLARDIDSNHLCEQMARTRPRIKEILRMWYSTNIYPIEDKRIHGKNSFRTFGQLMSMEFGVTPESYWWRHWDDYGPGKKRLPNTADC